MIHPKKYPALAQVLAASSQLKLPPKIKPLIKQNGDFSQIATWEAKIQENNSQGRDSTLKVGDFDRVRYIWINPKKKLFVPIAMSDEHHRGGDVMHDYLNKGLISGALKTDWIDIACGHTYVFDYFPKEMYLEAFKLWRESGGPNVEVETNSSSSSEKATYLGSMDDYLNKKGLTKIEKGRLAERGARLVKLLEQGAKALSQTLKTGKGEKRVFQAAQAILADLTAGYNGLQFLPEGMNEMKKKFADAEAAGDLQAIQDLVWGFNGIKNYTHNKLRKAVESAKKDPNAYDVEKLEKFFGDINLALKEFDRLGDI